MTSVDYLAGRQKYSRPQGILWADNPGSIDENGFRIPDGFEINSSDLSGNNFLILSDDNRSPIDVSKQRIEERKRTINGTMRSYHTADKLSLKMSWSMLPSRSFSSDPLFDTLTGQPGLLSGTKYTSDGGAGGAEILDWYENNIGSFWVYLSYDKYNEFEGTDDKFANLNKYSQVVEMFFSDFSYSVEKRGGSNFDFWNINVTLEEA